MSKRVPASEATRKRIETLLSGQAGSVERSELVKLAARTMPAARAPVGIATATDAASSTPRRVGLSMRSPRCGGSRAGAVP